MTLRLGYAGCGFMAQKVHIPNIVGLDGLALVALAEPRADLRERVAARYGVGRTYDSHRGLADDAGVDAVVVSGHYASQGDIAADLLAAGKHVLVEKPLATSVAQAESILRAEAASGGARLMVAYMKRYDPGYEIVRELLHDPAERERLGEVVHVRFHAFDGGEWIAGLDTPFVESAEPVPPAPDHWPDWLEPAHRTPYVLYLQQYTHNVNLLRWLFDADRVVVDHVDLDADGFTGIVVLRVAGQRAVLETAMAESVENDEQLHIYFERGWLCASSRPVLLRNQPVRVEVSRTTPHAGERTEITPAAWRWSYVEELRHFAEALASGEPFRSSGADTLADVEAFEAIFRRWQASLPHPSAT